MNSIFFMFYWIQMSSCCWNDSIAKKRPSSVCSSSLYRMCHLQQQQFPFVPRTASNCLLKVHLNICSNVKAKLSSTVTQRVNPRRHSSPGNDSKNKSHTHFLWETFEMFSVICGNRSTPRDAFLIWNCLHNSDREWMKSHWSFGKVKWTNDSLQMNTYSINKDNCRRCISLLHLNIDNVLLYLDMLVAHKYNAIDIWIKFEMVFVVISRLKNLTRKMTSLWRHPLRINWRSTERPSMNEAMICSK